MSEDTNVGRLKLRIYGVFCFIGPSLFQMQMPQIRAYCQQNPFMTVLADWKKYIG
jgi:hypothetical protein